MLKLSRMLILTVTTLAFIGTPVFLGCGKKSDETATSEQKQLWTCGMHPQVIQDHPGNCPICGMKLVPVKQETMAKGSHEGHEAVADTTAEKVATADKKDKRILYWRAPMDPTYISDKPGKSPMGMDLIPVYEGEEPGGGKTITIDPVTVQNIGVRTAEVKRLPFYRNIRTVGHVDYDEQRLYVVNTKFAGWIEKLYVDRTGDVVRKGQPLFTIYSPDLVTTQQEYLLALDNKRKLQSSGIAEIGQSAENLLAASRQRLKYWDISDKQIEQLERSGEISKTLTIYSPFSGIVIDKNIVEGANVKPGMDLLRIADLSKIWVYAHIFEYELPWIQAGQTVEMDLPYIPGKKFTGRVDYIYPYLDQKTRDVKLRLVFDNPTLELKPEMYANIRIDSRVGDEALVIPTEAIIRTGVRNLVFITLGDGKFVPREIEIGAEGEGGLVRVISGLNEGETIVTSAQFLLDSESRLREAIQKMLEPQQEQPSAQEPAEQMQSMQHQH